MIRQLQQYESTLKMYFKNAKAQQWDFIKLKVHIYTLNIYTFIHAIESSTTVWKPPQISNFPFLGNIVKSSNQKFKSFYLHYATSIN